MNNIIELVALDGSIEGAIIVPDSAMELWLRRNEIHILIPPEVKFWSREAPPDDHVRLNEVVIVQSPSRSDAAMIVLGTLWDFEKCKGCFFIPGYEFSKRGRR